MTVLRSREIPSVSGKPPLNRRSDIVEPATPARTQESNAYPAALEGPTNTFRRRSPRLAYQRGGDGSLNGFSETEVSLTVCSKRKPSLGSGERVGRNGVYSEQDGSFISEMDSSKLDMGSESNESATVSKRKRACGDLAEEDNILSKISDAVVNEEKGKTVMAQVLLVESKSNGKGEVKDSCEDNDEEPSSSMGRRKYTKEEKGKGIQAENVTNETTGVGVEEMEIDNTTNNQKPHESSGNVNAEQTQNHNAAAIGNTSISQHFRDIAEKNASRFARFDAQMEEEEELSDKEVEQPVEDWPGPFSTAMKIIKDREENTALHDGFPFSYKEKSSPIIWAPRRNHSFADPPRAPSLQELSLRILVKNADAITSLDYVPDSLRVKLCQLLCDSSRMDLHFLDLLVRGSPTGICVPDCSWLTEEQFTECFKNCDTSSLMVLQLDQCGRCMPDYVLPSTFARSPKNLPLLSSLSLSGAYRLTDVGLRALVSAAPAIRSLNLSQCSLLTSSSIDMLSDSLGSVLRELYLNECQNIDVELILSALKKFEKLEVLSLVDLPSVRGRFLRDFVTARGQALKQLILTNSVKLTDSTVKDISENCANLRVLDLANVCKLTDCALGYLANGCQALEKLIFCRNSFSDEAVAAFLETAGRSLMELSLNNVKKVGHNTALALAKLSEKLQILDVSWCRDISDHSLGYIVDNCSSLKVLKLFGCTQITDVFIRGHSNRNVKILGLKMDPFLDQKNLADS